MLGPEGKVDLTLNSIKVQSESQFSSYLLETVDGFKNYLELKIYLLVSLCLSVYPAMSSLNHIPSYFQWGHIVSGINGNFYFFLNWSTSHLTIDFQSVSKPNHEKMGGMIKTLFFLAPSVSILPMKYESLFSLGPLSLLSTHIIPPCLRLLWCSKAPLLTASVPWILSWAVTSTGPCLQQLDPVGFGLQSPDLRIQRETRTYPPPHSSFWKLPKPQHAYLE